MSGVSSASSIFWHQRRERRTIAKTIDERRREFHEDIHNGKIPYRRTRARSKQVKDAKHFDAWQERKRILKEAHYDNVNSIGEVDALTSSEVLGIGRGEVLRDPKLRCYVHPSLKLR